MAHFFQMRDKMDEATAQYFQMLQVASDNKARELDAAVKIQSTFRASVVRVGWHRTVRATRFVQRCIRGALARARTELLRIERKRRLNSIFFNHCASVIQKYFRGWWSRKNLHDFYGRKGYLHKVGMRGDWTVKYLHDQHQKDIVKAREEEEKSMRSQFDNLAAELHHLVSTKTIAGVYNPPYNDALPKAFEKPIEQHLRDACSAQLPKSLRRPRHRAAIESAAGSQMKANRSASQVPTGTTQGIPFAAPQDLPHRAAHRSRTANAGRMQKIQGPFRSREQMEVANAKASNTYSTVQAAAPYGVLDDDRKMQQHLEKLTRVSPIDFMAPGAPREAAPPSSVHTGVPFRERPFELRSDYSELPKIRDKPPFFTAVPGGKTFNDYQEQNLLPAGHV